MSERWNKVSEMHELRKDPACKPATAAATIAVALLSANITYSSTFITANPTQIKGMKYILRILDKINAARAVVSFNLLSVCIHKDRFSVPSFKNSCLGIYLQSDK